MATLHRGMNWSLSLNYKIAEFTELQFKEFQQETMWEITFFHPQTTFHYKNNFLNFFFKLSNKSVKPKLKVCLGKHIFFLLKITFMNFFCFKCILLPYNQIRISIEIHELCKKSSFLNCAHPFSAHSRDAIDM